MSEGKETTLDVLGDISVMLCSMLWTIIGFVLIVRSILGSDKSDEFLLGILCFSLATLLDIRRDVSIIRRRSAP